MYLSTTNNGPVTVTVRYADGSTHTTVYHGEYHGEFWTEPERTYRKQLRTAARDRLFDIKAQAAQVSRDHVRVLSLRTRRSKIVTVDGRSNRPQDVRCRAPPQRLFFRCSCCIPYHPELP